MGAAKQVYNRVEAAITEDTGSVPAALTSAALSTAVTNKQADNVTSVNAINAVLQDLADMVSDVDDEVADTATNSTVALMNAAIIAAIENYDFS